MNPIRNLWSTYLLPDLTRAIHSLHRILKSGGDALICDIVNPQEDSREFAEMRFSTWRSLGGRDLDATFAPFAAELIDLIGFVPETDRNRLGICRDDFYLIRLHKPEAQP